jgi:membrane protein implicated in regulation of membrane protease activity
MSDNVTLTYMDITLNGAGYLLFIIGLAVLAISHLLKAPLAFMAAAAVFAGAIFDSEINDTWLQGAAIILCTYSVIAATWRYQNNLKRKG